MPKKDKNLYDIEVTEVDKENQMHNRFILLAMEMNLMSGVISISIVISYHLFALKKSMFRTKNR